MSVLAASCERRVSDLSRVCPVGFAPRVNGPHAASRPAWPQKCEGFRHSGETPTLGETSGETLVAKLAEFRREARPREPLTGW